MGKRKKRRPAPLPPAGAPWWWPGEQLQLFELPEPGAQGRLFGACGCSELDPKPKRRRRAA